MIEISPAFSRCFLFAAVLALQPWSAALAAPEGASPWAEGFHTKARLLVGEVRSKDGARTVVAGIHLKMDKGWKTYWRNPGDSGIPPSFDWSGSKNLKKFNTLWPAPRRFADPYGSYIGYQDEVVFPVELTPARADRPLDLNVTVAYAVCKDVCIPAEAKLALTVPPGGEAEAPFRDLIGRYLKIVPPAAAAAGPGGPSVREVMIDLAKPKPYILVDAEFPQGTKGADLFVEGPKDFYLPMSQRLEGSGDRRVRFKVDLSQGDDPALLKGKELKLTLVSDKARVETTWPVE